MKRMIMIGNIIKQAREKQKLTQKELAKIIGIDPQNISRWEQDACEPGATSLIKIADVLGIKDKLFSSIITNNNSNIDNEVDINVELEKRIERLEVRLEIRMEKRLEERLETRLESKLESKLNDLEIKVENKLESKLKEDIMNDLRKEIQLEFNKRFDPIIQILTKNLTCETCNKK